METAGTSYPTARKVLKAPIEGAKRKRVLASIAAFHDEGQQPSVRQLTDRAAIKHWRTTDRLLQALERDGWLRVEWAKYRRGRNRYEVLVDRLP